MALTTQQSKQIKDYLVEKIRQKLTTYNPETNSMWSATANEHPLLRRQPRHHAAVHQGRVC